MSVTSDQIRLMQLLRRYEYALIKSEDAVKFYNDEIENFHYKDFTISSVDLKEWGFLLSLIKQGENKVDKLKKDLAVKGIEIQKAFDWELKDYAKTVKRLNQENKKLKEELAKFERNREED